jgi:hypothetical protein
VYCDIDEERNRTLDEESSLLFVYASGIQPGVREDILGGM